MKLDSLRDVFDTQLQDLQSAEQQLIDALPKVAAAAHSEELRTAFQEHLNETRGHLQRLDDLMPTVGAGPGGPCQAMQGLIRETQEIVSAEGDPLAKDAALITAAQRIEHYEIAAYGSAVALAGELGLDEAKDILDQTLDEEGSADRRLTKIATGGMFRSGVNAQAAR
jgi:ferritin-like metal-binding protein YciE